MSKSFKSGSASLRIWQLLLLVVILGVWHFASRDSKVAFFFGAVSYTHLTMPTSDLV